jgi:GGDEF domain-containing protein
MKTETPASARGMSYEQARGLILAAGAIVLGLLALFMYLRRVETVEVVAVLLFFPVFVALLLWDWVGGGISALVAGGIYVALRSPAIHAVGAGKFSGLIASRLLGLLAFGLIGGLANSQLRASLTKLDLYDQIDDDTGLFNARYFVQETDLEAARATRYKTFFAVAVVDIPLAWFAPLARRQQARLLRELGRILRESVRTVDRAVHSVVRGNHRLAVILPETGADGARLFADRLAGRLSEWLAGQGVSVDVALAARVVSFPGDDGTLLELREEFAAIDHIEHPLSPELTVQPASPSPS